MYNVLRTISKKRSRPKSNGHPANKYVAQDNCFMRHYHRLGIPRQLHYPSTTIAQLLDQSAQRYPHAPALSYDNLCWTYEELQQQVNRLAAGLATLGVRHNDRVVILLPNCPEFVTAFLAIHKLGAIVVNAGPLIGTDDLAKLIAMTEARLIIALDLQAPALAGLCQDRPNLKCLWVTLKDYQTVWKRMGYRLKLWYSRHKAATLSDQMMLHQLMAMSPARPPTVIPDPDDLAVLQPTGGTTGTQKVAQLSHQSNRQRCTTISLGQVATGTGNCVGNTANVSCIWPVVMPHHRHLQQRHDAPANPFQCRPGPQNNRAVSTNDFPTRSRDRRGYV